MPATDSLLQQILQGSMIPTFVINDQHVVVHWNTACEKLTGVPAKDVVGTNRQWRPFYEQERPVLADLLLDQVPGEQIKSLYKNYRRSSLTDEGHEAEAFLPTLGERGRWLFFTAVPLRNAEGSIIGAIETLQDITDRKEAEIQSEKARQEWRRTFNSIDDILTIQDKEMRIVRVNEAACRFFEASKEELLGKYCYEIFRGSDAPCHGCPVSQTLKDVASHSEIMQHKKLEKIFHVSSSPILDDDNQLEYLVHVAKDITEQKKMESEIFQAHKMEAIGTLAAGIAHDFNNILTAIYGYSELALEETSPEQQSKSDIREVLLAARRAKELVQQILSFSRKTPQKHNPVLPAPIIKEALKLMRASLPSTISIRQRIDNNCGTIMGDPTQLHQVLVNLCTNAFHAMEETGGTLSVTLRKAEADDLLAAQDHDESGKNNFIMLSVSDTGSGIDEAILPYIFDPYYTTKEKGKGTGMGLALVQDIVKNMDGSIEVETKGGQGTAFHILFQAGEKTKERQDFDATASLPKGNEHILLVDDEPTIVDFEKRILEKLGYQVTATTDSLEALKTFKEQPDTFSLLLSDQTMPHMTGVELATEMLRIREDLPIILCSGYSQNLIRQHVLDSGIYELLIKPVSIADLAQKIRSALEKNLSSLPN